MATSSKDQNRRAVVEQMRREQQSSERKRTFLIFGVVGLVALVIIGLGAYPLVKDAVAESKYDATGLEKIGVAASQAGCQDVKSSEATGSADHRPEGETLTYPDSPPASGSHYATWAQMDRKFYTEKDRPELGYLVHNLEHGYNILWYDETIAEDADKVADVEGIASKFPGTSDPENKFIAAPWTSDDGDPFPEGTHIAMTHWSMGGTHGNDEGQRSIWQYCAEPSGEAVSTFVEDYPYTDSPEPNAG